MPLAWIRLINDNVLRFECLSTDWFSLLRRNFQFQHFFQTRRVSFATPGLHFVSKSPWICECPDYRFNFKHPSSFWASSKCQLPFREYEIEHGSLNYNPAARPFAPQYGNEAASQVSKRPPSRNGSTRHSTRGKERQGTARSGQLNSAQLGWLREADKKKKNAAFKHRPPQPKQKPYPWWLSSVGGRLCNAPRSLVSFARSSGSWIRRMLLAPGCKSRYKTGFCKSPWSSGKLNMCSHLTLTGCLGLRLHVHRFPLD